MSIIESFIERVTLASKSNSKEIRFQIIDAVALMTELAVLGSRNAVLSDQVIKLQNDIIKIQASTQKKSADSEELTIEMDGGGFN